VFTERMVPVALQKIFGDSNVGYIDWRNPCGDASISLTFDADGTILPNDDARSLRAEFALGNVHDVDYDTLVRQRETFRTMNLSLRDRDAVCRECSYNPYCGVQPVLDFARRGDAIPRPHESDECLFTISILDWLFEKLLTDPLPVARMLSGMDEFLRRHLDPAVPS
jgi:radical SAM protein with 4Fe4S-binding SPASM domain